TEVDSRHIAATEHAVSAQSCGTHGVERRRRQLRRAFIFDQPLKIPLDLQAVNKPVRWVAGQHAHDAEDLWWIVPQNADGDLVALDKFFHQDRLLMISADG